MNEKLNSFSAGFQDGYSCLLYNKPENENYMNGWREGQKFQEGISSMRVCPAVMEDKNGNLIVTFPYILHDSKLV